MHRTLLLLSLSSLCFAQARLPLQFDHDPGWQPKPTFLPNPAAAPKISAQDGAVTLSVSEPGKGMKFELPLRPFDAEGAAYLVLRYKAQNLAGGYALWVGEDSGPGRELINTGELIRDGQWHVVAVEPVARGVVGLVHSLLTEVECAGPPASITFGSLAMSDELPEGAQVIPVRAQPGPQQTVRLADVKGLTPEPGWLAAPADKYGVEVQGEALHLFAQGADKGMKFSAPLPEPVDLARYRWVAIRYRARNTAPWGDYFLWLGSEAGGTPQKTHHVMWLNQVTATDTWRVAVLPLAPKEPFVATHLALQVGSAGERGDEWIDTVRFCADRPLLDIGELLPLAAGWGAAPGQAEGPGRWKAVDLSALVNARAQSRLRGLGLASWFPPGKITVRGIPFETPAGPRDVVVTPEDINQTLTVPVGARASEAYLLLSARLPARDSERMGDPVPMQHTDRPERFLVRVAYADGVTDETFPLLVASSQYDLQPGPEVYCLPGLRPVPIRSLALRNRMDSARFLLAAVTLNQGAALQKQPAPFSLPAAAERAEENPGRGQISEVEGGYVVSNDLLVLELKTTGGIAVRGLSFMPYGGRGDSLIGPRLEVQPGPLFEVGVERPAGDKPGAPTERKLLTSEQVAVGAPTVTAEGEAKILRVPFDAGPAGVPVRGALVVTVGRGADILMHLELTHQGQASDRPIVSFPLIHGMKIGRAQDTWYLWAKKGGLVSNRDTDQWGFFGGEYPLQVADVFGPQAGRGVALLTYDRDNIGRYWHLLKTAEGVTWRMDYLPYEHQSGETIEVAPTALRAHSGDWRRALAIYRDWARSWYRPQVPRKDWFRGVFYYQQVFAWSQLYKPGESDWPMKELIQRYRDYFGRLDYLHIFDFGDSHVYGRVGDYNHYEELGGLPMMQRAIKQAQDLGVPVGLYLEGYLCDIRCAWGKENVLRNCIRNQDGSPMLWETGSSEYVMCGAAPGWRAHLADCYRRAAADLHPNGLYIDEYGFLGGWRTCWARDHSHPVPWPPNRGERETTRAIRAATPPQIATLTEETPNDLNSQYQDGALGYSVTSADPVLAPHRIDLLRFAFPDFKVFQLTNYNHFEEGGWQLLKCPFFNGEGFWLHGSTDFYCEDAHQFLRQAFRILHDYRDCFCAEDVEPLVPTPAPGVFANRFSGAKRTAWTLLNGDFRTYRGPVLRVPHREGARYVDAFTGNEVSMRMAGQYAEIMLELGPKGVGCVVEER